MMLESERRLHYLFTRKDGFGGGTHVAYNQHLGMGAEFAGTGMMSVLGFLGSAVDHL